jgi:hypothetical protein
LSASRRKKTTESVVFLTPRITSWQDQRQQEPQLGQMRQRQGQGQQLGQMRQRQGQQLERERQQARGQRLEPGLLLFCRKQTRQQQQ